MIRRPPRSTLSSSSAASDVYKRQAGVAVITATTVDGAFTATCTVTVTAPVVSGGSAPAATISTAAIAGVTAPVNGATPVTAITEATQYTGTVTWAPAGSPF